MKSLTFSCLIDMCSKPIFCSKNAQKDKICSRLLEPQKFAPNAKSCSKVAEHNRERPRWVLLRWLDWIFFRGYLPGLRINYVAMSKDMRKRLPQLYYIKMKISYDLGFNAIGVTIAT